MIDFFKKHYIIATIIGGLFLAAGLVMLITSSSYVGSDKNRIDLVEVFSGIILILIAVYIIRPIWSISKGTSKSLLMFELVLIVLISVIGFLLPAITELAGSRIDILASLGLSGKSISFWLGIVLYIHGFIEVIISVRGGTAYLPRVIFLGIGLITLGCWLIFKGFSIENQLVNIAAWAFTIVGVLLAAMGLLSIIKVSQTSSQEPSKKQVKHEDKKDETSAEQTTVDKKKKKKEKKEKKSK